MLRSSVSVVIGLLLLFSFEQSQAASHVLFFAHRGASAYAPENTLEAFQLAVELGTDYIELDVQLTKDDHLVVIHDDKVDRTSNGTGYVKEYTLAELKTLDAGSWFNERYTNVEIPSLEEVFQTFGSQVRYCIEIKEADRPSVAVTSLHQMIENYQLTDNVIVQSFDEEVLQLFDHKRVHYPLIQIISRPKRENKAKKQLDHVQEYADGVCLNSRFTSPSFVKKARKRGLMVHMYTINERQEMENWMNEGVTGIITDDLRLRRYY